MIGRTLSLNSQITLLPQNPRTVEEGEGEFIKVNEKEARREKKKK